MNGLRSCVGRSLLVLVLAGAAFGCGDDDDNPATDAGGDGGPDSGPMAGRGSAGTGADAGDAGPTMSECVDKTSDNTQGMAPAACIQCVCEEAPREAVACNSTCWALVQCYALNCADVPVDNPNASAACAADKCEDFVGEIGAAMDLGPTIDGVCLDECVMLPPEPEDDAGVDAG